MSELEVLHSLFMQARINVKLCRKNRDDMMRSPESIAKLQATQEVLMQAFITYQTALKKHASSSIGENRHPTEEKQSRATVCTPAHKR